MLEVDRENEASVWAKPPHIVGVALYPSNESPSEPGTPDTSMSSESSEMEDPEDPEDPKDPEGPEDPEGLEDWASAAVEMKTKPPWCEVESESKSTGSSENPFVQPVHDYVVTNSAHLREHYLGAMIKKAELPLNLKALLKSWGTVQFLATAVALVMAVASTICLFPPAYVPGFGAMDLLLPPIPYYMLLTVSVGVLAGFSQSYEEFVQGGGRTFKFLALRWACYYTGIVMLRLLAYVNESTETTLILEFSWSATSLGMDILLVASMRVWKSTRSLRSLLTVLGKLTPTAVYILGLTGMFLLNALVLSGSGYLGFIVLAEKAVLRLFKLFALHTAPCGYPRWLLCVSVHFEIDLQILAALALASVRSPWVAAQHMLGDWLVFMFKCKSLLYWDVNLTMDKLQDMHWFSRCRMKFSIFAAGSSALFPQHLFVAKCIHDVLEGLAQTATLIATLFFLAVMTAVGTYGKDVYRKEFQHYFLSDNMWGIAYIALMLLFSMSQDAIVQLILATRGVLIHRCLRDFTLDWKHTVFYATVTGASSIWIFFAASSLAWYHGVHCHERSETLCVVAPRSL